MAYQIHPLGDDHNMPQILYVNGDTVSLTFAETSDDFSYLTANHPKKADEFYPLVPHLSSPIFKSDCVITPLIAVKVTLFPNIGICIGFVNNHVAGDARTIVGFMNAWASIHKLGGGDEHLLPGNSLPSYDRSVVEDPNGRGTLIWNLMKDNIKVQVSKQINLQTDRVRATYVITKDQIQMLKNLVSNKCKNKAHVSSFTVTCAYVWTCLVRSSIAATGEEMAVVDDDAEEYLIFPVDCRERLDPPLPGNYSGNCLRPCIVRMNRNRMMDDNGFSQAAKSIGDAIHELVNNKDGILGGFDSILSKLQSIGGKPTASVAGSPKFDVYDGDYGWGKPKKFEAVSIDLDNRSMSLSKSRECEGGLEVGLSLSRILMDAFATLFVDGFKV